MYQNFVASTAFIAISGVLFYAGLLERNLPYRKHHAQRRLKTASVSDLKVCQQRQQNSLSDSNVISLHNLSKLRTPCPHHVLVKPVSI